MLQGKKIQFRLFFSSFPARLEVDRDNFKTLEATKDVSLVASALKLFFRELPHPLIPKEARDYLHGCANEKNQVALVKK